MHFVTQPNACKKLCSLDRKSCEWQFVAYANKEKGSNNVSCFYHEQRVMAVILSVGVKPVLRAGGRMYSGYWGIMLGDERDASKRRVVVEREPRQENVQLHFDWKVPNSLASLAT